MTAKTPASKAKPAANTAVGRAQRVTKQPEAPALKMTVVAPIKVKAGKTAAKAAKPVPARLVDTPATAPKPAAMAQPVPVTKPAAVAPTIVVAPVIAAAPVTVTPTKPSARVIPLAAALKPKDPTMAAAFETTQDAVRSTVSQLNTQAEAAINNGKAAMEQVTAKSKEAVEASMKSMEDLTEMTRANVNALIASAKAATAGVEQVMTQLTEASKKSFEDTSAMVKTLATAKTPNELMQLQSDFAKTQFDEAVSQYSKLTEMMIKLAGEVMEPVQNQVAISTDKLKSAWTAK